MWGSPVSAFASNKAFDAAMETAAAILELGLDAVQFNLRARPLIVNWLDWFPKQPPTLSRKECEAAGGWSSTQQISLEKRDELESFLDGSRRRIITKSFVRRQIALALMSYPLDGPERKARLPRERFQKAARPRTEAELEGLRKANAKRAREAELRREAKTKTERRVRASPNIVAE
jgi:hypothetical protein